MIKFAETYLGIISDGNLTTREGLIFFLLAALALLLVVALVLIVKGLVMRRLQKKNSIFRNKKNRYKSRLGKKNIKY